MVKFIELIQDIGFVNTKSEIPEFIRYSFGYHYITIVSNNNMWSMSKSVDPINTGPWIKFDGKYGFEFDEIGLLKEHFISYFRDIKIKQLGI